MNRNRLTARPNRFALALRALVAVLLCLSWPAFAASQAARPNTEMPPDIERILKKQELVVAIPSFDTRPFYFVENGELRGVDIQLARDIAASLKVPLRFTREAKSVNELVDIVASGKADMALGKLSRTTSRVLRVRFSQPYVIFHHALAINRVAFARIAHGRHLEDVIRDFRGSIAVLEKSAFVEFAAENFPHAKVVQMPDWDTAIAALRKGEVTAVYRDELEIKRLIKTSPASALTLRTVTLTDTVDSIGIAVNPASHQLLALIDLYLGQRVTMPTADSILRQWKNEL